MDLSKCPVAKRTRSCINRFLIEKHLESRGKRVKTAAGAVARVPEPEPEPVEFILVDKDEGGSGGVFEKGNSSKGDLGKKKGEECNASNGEEVIPELEQEMDQGKKTKSSKNKVGKLPARRISKADEEFVFQSGDVPRPNNPFFLTKKRKDRSMLYVPPDVLNAYNIKLPKDLLIYDERNRKYWKSEVRVWKDGRIWVVKGWKRFCKWNYVQLTDLCIIEFVGPTEEAELFLKVRVIRRPASS